MPRGNAFMQEWEVARIAEREAVHVTERCQNCKWTLEGTVKETREAFLAHRLEAHPEIQPKPRRKRHRPFSSLNSMGPLDENIANARTQGAATWAGTS